MEQSRRAFIKSLAAAWATGALLGTTTAGNQSRQEAQAAMTADPSIRWSKAPCRFCGTGCGVMVGVRNGQVVAVAGDVQNPVNKGLLCVKGYHLPFILTGEDRLRRPQIREGGKLRDAGWDEALDLIAKRFGEAVQAHGPQSVSIYGSGQWTIQDGYAANKFFKGGLGSNNVEANARLCMASAVVGFIKTFGKDEPMGCYEDFEEGDVFVFWGNNMAEMHPVLFSRIVERRRQATWVRLVDIATRRTRTSDASDMLLLMDPHGDLAIANGICRLIIQKGRHNEAFIQKHVVFRTDNDDIGFGLRDGKGYQGGEQESSFEAYTEFLEKYTPEYVEQVAGIPPGQLNQLADLYADPGKKVVSL